MFHVLTHSCTYPLIGGISLFLGSIMWPNATPTIKLIFSSAVLFCLYNLSRTAFSDPGILRKHHEPPAGEAGRGWTYTDQGSSYRPPNAFYSTEVRIKWLVELKITQTTVGRQKSCLKSLIMFALGLAQRLPRKTSLISTVFLDHW